MPMRVAIGKNIGQKSIEMENRMKLEREDEFGSEEEEELAARQKYRLRGKKPILVVQGVTTPRREVWPRLNG